MTVKDNSSQVKFWRIPHLDNLQLLHVSNVTYDYPRHIHEEYSIVVMLRGAETTVYRQADYTAFPGSLLLINADEAHSSKSVASEYRIIKIKPETLNRIALEVCGHNLTTLCFLNPVIEDALIFRLLLNLHLKLEQTVSPLEQESEFISTIGLLLTRQNKNHFTPQRLGKENHYVELARDYLKSHYAENITLARLTSITNLSAFHLLRVFRNQVGVPPHEYQTQIRVAQARKLLRDGHSISDAAVETGFFDQSHFSRNFKRITGRTPGRYVSENSNIVQDRKN